MAKGYTNEGTKWEFAHSFWLVSHGFLLDF